MMSLRIQIQIQIIIFISCINVTCGWQMLAADIWPPRLMNEIYLNEPYTPATLEKIKELPVAKLYGLTRFIETALASAYSDSHIWMLDGVFIHERDKASYIYIINTSNHCGYVAGATPFERNAFPFVFNNCSDVCNVIQTRTCFKSCEYKPCSSCTTLLCFNMCDIDKNYCDQCNLKNWWAYYTTYSACNRCLK